MPRQITPGASFWVRLRGEAPTGNGSGDDAQNPLTYEQANSDLGRVGEQPATTDTGNFSLLSLFQRLLLRISLVYKDVSGQGTAVKVAIVEGGGGGSVTVANPVTSVAVSSLPATEAGNLATVASNTAAGTAITGATIPAGGVGRIGWLSAIWQQISTKLPSLVASQADVQAVRDRLITGGPSLGAGTAAAAQRTTLASDSPGIASLNTIATSALVTPVTAVTTASNHLALSNTNATPLAGSQILCESVALFPQQANGAANAASIFVGLTAARQRVLVTPGLTIGPFPGHPINLQDIRIQGTAGDGVEFWVVQ
jgi:hypothetical protein